MTVRSAIAARFVAALLAAVSLGGLPLAAQDATGTPLGSQEEARLLREAAALEWRGRTEEAADTLEALLARDPSSSGGLYALERVLRSLGRVGGVLSHVDRLLATEPSATGAHTMKVRVLAEIDSLEALEPAARAWFAAEPGSPAPYREVARIFRRAGDDQAALEVLRDGRGALGDEALALDLGDALAESGDEEAAVEEWARALSPPGADHEMILRRIERLQGDRGRLAEPLVAVLQGEPATLERRVAAVELALRHPPHDEREVLEVAERGLEGLGGGDPPSYLDAVARATTEAGVHGVAYWALGRIRETTGARPAASLDARLAAAALAAGDTAAALEAQTRLARELPAGSPERRRVVADLIRVEAGSEDAETLARRLDGFRREFPDAPEADDLAAVIASGLAARGDADGALQVADQAQGPRSQLERAWLLFRDGRVDEGRAALEGSVPELAPIRATEVVQLLAQLDRVGPAAGSALAMATAHSHHGRLPQAVSGLEAALDSVPVADRAPLHARAAQIALEARDTARAEGHLRRVVDEHEDSAEAPEALLTLARVRASAPDGVDEARALLERLILERPQAAVVPAARRELQRLGRSG
jgi:tetratricopeptide (TPR) repeat protein